MTSTVSAFVTLALTSILLAACHRAAPPRPSAAPSPGELAPPPPRAAETPLSLPDRLAREAATRPSGVIAVEAVMAALRGAGVPIGTSRQVLARPIGARYCALARTPAGLVASVCEFEDDGQAARGVDLSRRTFDALIPGRRLVHKRGTALTLTAGGDPGRSAQAARAEAAFAAL